MEQVLAGPYGPLLIFLLRICDVSMATLRLLYAVRGRKVAAAVLGFVEILIWILAVATVVRNLGSPLLVVGYAAGFGAGTYIGISLEERLALGVAEVRAVSRRRGLEIAGSLRSLGHGATQLQGEGRDGPVTIVTTVVPRRALPKVLKEVRRVDPDAFVTVEEPRLTQKGWLLSRRRK